MSWTRLRGLTQAVFLALFVLLLCKSDFPSTRQPFQTDIRLFYPVSIFLEADPLAAISTAISTGSLYRGLLWSLVIIVPTLFIGRFFCGWICPLGTLNHFFANFKSEKKSGRRLIESNRYKGWQRLKYYLLVALLISALFGTAVVGILDPMSLSVRSLGLAFLPGFNYGMNALLDLLYRSEVGAFRLAADTLHFLLKDTLLSYRQHHVRQAFVLGLIFIIILALNFRITRFWCRAICPLGALLGVMSRWSILGLEKQPVHCDNCGRCLLHCQGGDDPAPGSHWRKAECHLCLNCVADCPESGIQFKFFPSTSTTVEGPNLQRRKVIAGLAAGAAVVPALRSNTGLSVEYDGRLLRPPGAVDERDFLERCIRCGECMKVCPNNALHPTLFQAGIEGLWTPVLVPRVGYCEPSCILCGQICPSGAIWEFTPREKAWVTEHRDQRIRPIRLGTAFYDRGRCLPWAMATECIVCEEWCPTSPKAIYLQAGEMVDSAGVFRKVRQPYVDPERCIGCGACEYACPVQDQPAIYVTSIGESRSKSNQFILRRPVRRKSSTDQRTQ